MGKLNKNGDEQIYDEMVRIEKDLEVRYKIVEGKGNLGNIEGDKEEEMR